MAEGQRPGDSSSNSGAPTQPSEAADPKSHPESSPSFPPGAIPPPPGLIAWWSGDSHATDYVGANQGSLQGGATYAPGLVGDAFRLDGIDDYIRIPHSDSLNTPSGFTVECWILPNSDTGLQNIVSRLNNEAQDFAFSVQLRRSGLNFFLSEDGRPYLGFAKGSTPLTPGKWIHLAATFDGVAARIYVNAVLDAMQSFGGQHRLYAGSADILIGAGRSHDPNCHFSGIIDELSLYSRALSEFEIRSIFQAGAAGKIKPADAAHIVPYADVERKASLASAAHRSNDYAKSEGLWRETWHGRQKTLGPQHYQTIDAENLFGESLAKQGKHEQAEERLLASYGKAQKVRTFPGNWILIYRSRLAEMYGAWGKREEAEKWRAMKSS